MSRRMADRRLLSAVGVLAAVLLAVCSCSQLLELDAPYQFGTTTSDGTGGAGGTGGATNVGGESAGGGGATGGSGGTGDAAAGGQGGNGSTFFDDFERPDGPDVGNGWIEKIGGVFSLSEGRVVMADTPSTSYRATMVYRPATEDVLDVEAMVEFDVLDPNVRYPQLFVRAQSGTIATPNEYAGYLLYVAGAADTAVLGQQPMGNTFVTTLETIAISPPLTTGQVYRLRLRAEGTDPVFPSTSSYKRPSPMPRLATRSASSTRPRAPNAVPRGADGGLVRWLGS